MAISASFLIPRFINYRKDLTISKIVCILQLFVAFQLTVWFLTLHLSFYSIFYRINCLSSLIDTFELDDSDEIQENDKAGAIYNRLKLCGYLFNQLSYTSSLLNSVFCFPVFLALTNLTINSLSTLYFILYDFILKKSLSYMIIQNGLICVYFGSFIFIILQAADSTIKVVKPNLTGNYLNNFCKLLAFFL